MSQGNDKLIFEKFDAANYKAAIAVAGFNKSITDAMLAESRKCFADYKIAEENVTVIEVAGCVEIPVILQYLAGLGNYDCMVAIGAIIRGDTPHFDYVAKAVTEGVMRVSLDHVVPIGFGVLTVENQEQALARLHVGYEATEAAIQSAKKIKEIH